MDHLPKTHKQPIIANNIKQNNILLTFHQGQKQLVKNLATVIINRLIFHACHFWISLLIDAKWFLNLFIYNDLEAIQ